MQKQLFQSLGTIILCCIVVLFGCKKDIKKSDIGTNAILIKNDSCFAFLPNAFTPNGDGLNDVIRPRFLNNSTNNFTFTVRNTRQKILFETTDLNESWDATYKGDNEPESEYIATLKGILPCGMTFEEHTCVNLFRNCVGGDVQKMSFESMFDPVTGSVLYPSGEQACQ